MLTYFIYGIRSLLIWVGNLLRRVGKPPGFILYILEGDYPEVPVVGVNPLLRYFRPPKISLLEISEQIRMIAEDSRVKGVVFHLRPLTMPLAKIDVLRALFMELKSSGKAVVTWSYTYDTVMYYLASAADNIYLLPGGSLEPMGLYRQYTYLADALAWVGVQAEFIQITPYKSAGDAFTRNEMSHEVREMGNWLADSVYGDILDAVSMGRKIDRDTARSLLDQTPCTDHDALEMGAVDGLYGEDDLPKILSDLDKPVKLDHWNAVRRRLFRRPIPKPGKYIALMSIEGIIIDGRSGNPPVEPPFPVPLMLDPRAGDISVVQTIRQIKADKRAAAVIVYVDSRGGSATASESIRMALGNLASTKPLFIVMGPVAASGGYWVSLPGKKIFAQPNTITGSIGVLAGKIADSGLIEKLLVRQEVIRRGENIAIFKPEAPFTVEERDRVYKFINHVYGLFIEKVVESRDLPPDKVDPIAGGRVWTGRQAFENGLVDELGGLDEAFHQVKDIYGLDDRTQVRFITPGKQILPPVPEPATILKYAYDNLAMVNGRAMCILPWNEKS